MITAIVSRGRVYIVRTLNTSGGEWLGGASPMLGGLVKFGYCLLCIVHCEAIGSRMRSVIVSGKAITSSVYIRTLRRGIRRSYVRYNDR